MTDEPQTKVTPRAAAHHTELSLADRLLLLDLIRENVRKARNSENQDPLLKDTEDMIDDGLREMAARALGLKVHLG